MMDGGQEAPSTECVMNQKGQVIRSPIQGIGDGEEIASKCFNEYVHGESVLVTTVVPSHQFYRIP